jgi:hypothetical protein
LASGPLKGGGGPDPTKKEQGHLLAGMCWDMSGRKGSREVPYTAAREFDTVRNKVSKGKMKSPRIAVVECESTLPHIGKCAVLPFYGTVIIGSIIANAGYSVAILVDGISK